MKKHYAILFLLILQQSFANTFAKIDPPTVSISYPASATCASDVSVSAIITGSGDINGGTFTSEPGLQIDPATGEINPSGSAPGTYTIIYTVMASGENPSVSASTTITILPMPSAFIVSTSGDSCFGDTATFCISGTPFADVTYSINGGGPLTVELDPSGTVCIAVMANSGSIACNLISITSSGIPSCYSMLSGSAIVNVNTPPQIQLASQYTIEVQDGTVTSPALLDTQLSESTYTFQWYVDGEIIAGATGSTYLVATASESETPRQYAVSVNTIGTSCQTSASCMVMQTMLGVGDVTISDLKFGPNPFSENLSVKAKEAIQNISISNIRGQIVYSQKYNTSEVSINTSDLNAGTYFVKVTSAGRQQVFKAVKR